MAPQSRYVHPSEADQAEQQYRAGATLKQVADRMGIPRQRLAVLLRERGVPLRRRQPTANEVAEMKRRYLDGESLRSIGTRLSFSDGTVRRRLLDQDVPMRDPHGNPR
ncbi:helix-turn-helix domain-containing protein [Nesterenkonia alkaliphila]|uniref:Helix-turn-helix domain-containing protein n=1 Tax=Nesterenkonia alkaliphila TaxID=1463631 RepID=A0A7K1UHC8_9MICC|nr:hypothetical protein [Nesterenkonia alkaliphila]MVT25471.1 hypothetical protein [Nesterenkonia alkaliphila]